MQFRLYYSMHADPDPITQVRIFISREAALDYALRLYCDGYELYVLEGDNGEALDAVEILENARARGRPSTDSVIARSSASYSLALKRESLPPHRRCD